MDKSLAKHKYNGYRLKVLPGLINSEFLDICCREKFPESGDFQPVPASDYARVFRFNYKNQWYFHKTFCPRNIMEPVKNFIRGSRADRSLKGHSILADNGFLAPPIVIVGNKKQHNFIVTISVPMHISLGDFCRITRVGMPIFFSSIRNIKSNNWEIWWEDCTQPISLMAI